MHATAKESLHISDRAEAVVTFNDDEIALLLLVGARRLYIESEEAIPVA